MDRETSRLSDAVAAVLCKLDRRDSGPGTDSLEAASELLEEFASLNSRAPLRDTLLELLDGVDLDSYQEVLDELTELKSQLRRRAPPEASTRQRTERRKKRAL